MNPAEHSSQQAPRNGSQPDPANGSGRRERRHFTAQQKVAIVKRHLVDGVSVSDLCDQHQILPTQFYQWQKQLFEGAAAAFKKKPGRLAGQPALAGQPERS